MKEGRVILAAIAGLVAGFVALRTMRRRKLRMLPYGQGIKLKKAVTINRPVDELYRSWRNLEFLPQLIQPLFGVKMIDNNHACRKISIPGCCSLKWFEETTIDRENEMIGWRTLEDSDIDMAGYVRFEPATGGRGTVVRIALQYNPPAGKLGAALATAVGRRPGNLVEEAL